MAFSKVPPGTSGDWGHLLAKESSDGRPESRATELFPRARPAARSGAARRARKQDADVGRHRRDRGRAGRRHVRRHGAAPGREERPADHHRQPPDPEPVGRPYDERCAGEPGGHPATAIRRLANALFLSPLPLWERVAERTPVREAGRGVFLCESSTKRPLTRPRFARAPSPTRGEGRKKPTLRRPLVWARGLRLIPIRSPRKSRGWSAARRYTRVLPPCGGWRAGEHAAPCGAPLRHFSSPGHAFGGARAVVSQLLAGGSGLSPRWSPGPPCTGMPAGCGSRVDASRFLRTRRRRYRSRISGPFLRPGPLSRRLMSAPLGEQGAGIIGEVFGAGINYFHDRFSWPSFETPCFAWLLRMRTEIIGMSRANPHPEERGVSRASRRMATNARRAPRLRRDGRYAMTSP